MWTRWSWLQRAIWRHDAPVDAEEITKGFERENWWSRDASDDPIDSMALHVQDEKTVLLVARFGSRERRWEIPATPRDEDYASVQAWLEREVRTSDRVDLSGEPAVPFAQVKLLMASVFAAGQPSFAFRVLR